jgi:hypothetical protein|tara:strand:- start:556 stop:783 length:228 start_codon:yes stop_codon:yes gene_type:complete
MNPLGSDPDFYRKVVGMMQQSKQNLKINIHGNELSFWLNDKHIGNINGAEFYKMTANEIWKQLGVSNEHKKRWFQ